MHRFQSFVALAGAALFLGLGALALAGTDDPKEKVKPKDAAIFDDQAGTLTGKVEGKETKKEIDAKYCLKVKGYFDSDGFNMEDVEADGPATHLSDASGNNNMIMLEKGDIITEVDGKKVKSAEDYAKAINGAADHAKTKIKVKDVRTGDESEFFADAAKR
jgi:S1-C subfamily serine protease